MTVNILDLARDKHIDPKKVAATGGGEYHSPCPGCGGVDRFHIWPMQGDFGAYWCRQCGKWGDNIQFLRDFEGLSFKEACARLNIDKSYIQNYQTPRPPASRQNTQAWEPDKKKDPPPDLWQKKAAALVEWAHENLLETNEQLQWLAARGIHLDAVKKYKLGWNPGKDGKDLFRPRESWGLPTVFKDNGQKKKLWIPAGLIIPLIENDVVLRIRIRRPSKEGPRYYVLPGSSMGIMIISESDTDERAAVIVESELDAMMMAQKAGDLAIVVALGNTTNRPDDRSADVFRNMAVILNALDYDEAGAKTHKWWKENFPQTERWPVPKGGDPGEAYQAGVDIRAWISAGLPSAWSVGRFSPDLKKRGADFASGFAEATANRIGLVEELAGYLKEHPVSIYCTAERTAIRQSRKFERAFPGVSRRISELVFGFPEVLEYLEGHPDDVIDGRNIQNGAGAGY